MADRTVRVRLLAEVAGFKQAMKDARTETERTAHQFDRDGKKIETSAGRLVRSAQVNREAWSTAGNTLAGFGTAGVLALAAATKAAIDWESAWTGVLKTVDGTSDQLAALEGDLRTMATTLPATHSEIAAVAEAAGQLGVQTDNIAAFTRVMVDLGETTNLTADEAATSLAQLMNVMQTSPNLVGNLGSAVVALGNDGASTERDIVQMAQRIAGAGKTIGLTEGDVLGLANALASVGIEVEAGGSAISNIMIDIAKAVSSNTPELQEWARVAGMSAEEFAQAWKSDPTDALEAFVTGLGRANAAGEDIFGTLDALGQSDVRVSRALLTMASAGDLLTASIELGNDAMRDESALIEEANKRYDTRAAKLEIARNSIHDAAITIGETFLPALGALADAVADAAGGFAKLPGPLQEGIGILGALTAATALASGAFLKIVPKIAETADAMDRLRNNGSRIPGIFGAITKGAGAATAVLTVVTAVDALAKSLIEANQVATGAGEMTKALLEVADGAATVDEALSGIGMFQTSKGALPGSPVDTQFTKNVSDLAASFAALEQSSLGFWDGWNRSWSSSSFSKADQSQAVADWATLDQALTSLTQAGHADTAARIFDAVAEASGRSRAAVRVFTPEYVDAMASVDVANTIAGTSAQENAARQQALAEEQQKVIDQWKDMAGVASASFINIEGAYQSVIDKNVELAQASADATESTGDSWRNFYDGLTVDSQSYLKQLEAQVDAQLTWQENMYALAERIDGLDAGSRDNAQQLIEELLNGGVDQAPLVQMYANLSDADFQHLVDLYGNAGTAASEEFATRLAEDLGLDWMEPAAIPLDADMTAATNTVNKWLSSFGVDAPVALTKAYTRRLAYDERHQGFSTGGGVWGAGTGTSDSIPAWLSNGEYVQTAAAHRFWGTSTMDAMRRQDVGEVLVAASRLARRGYAEGGPVTGYPRSSAEVITVPVESRHETHHEALSTVQFTGDFHGADYEAIMREARAARRLASLGGNRG